MYVKLVDQLIKREIINPMDADLYLYGLRNGILLLISIIAFLAIGLIFNKFVEIIVFLLSYAPLRQYCGGYHAKTAKRCFIGSVLAILLVIVVLDNINWTIELCFLAVLISALIIFKLAPVADPNKPFDEDEVWVFKESARFVLAVELLLIVVFIQYGFIFLLSSMSLAFIAIALMLVLGALKWKYLVVNGN